MSAENLLTFLHLLGAFWYVIGLTAVQIPLARGWQAEDLNVQLIALEETSHYESAILLPGVVAAGITGLLLWAQVGYNPVTTGWLLLLEGLYLLTAFIFLPLFGLGVRRARLAALQSRHAGERSPELQQTLEESVPLIFSGLATLMVPLMAYLSVFKPF